MAKRVHLDEEPDLQLLDLAQVDDPVEDRFPILVPGKIVVGDEEAAQSLRDVFADDLLDVVRRAAARFAALHVDDRAEGTLERATASGVEAGHVPAVRCARTELMSGIGIPSMFGRSAMKL